MSGLLNLPPELRLNVYHHLLLTSIADGKPTDAAGLLLTCRTVYNELRADFIPAVATILSALHQWNTHYTECLLKIDLPHDYNFRQPPTQATVNFPFGPQWVESEQHGLEVAIQHLSAVLHQPWDRLTFGVYYPFTHESFLVTWDDFRAVLVTVFRVMWHDKRVDKIRNPYLSETKRLILSLDTSLDFPSLQQITFESTSMFFEAHLMSLFAVGSVKHVRWVTYTKAQTHLTWSLGYDLNTGRDW